MDSTTTLGILFYVVKSPVLEFSAIVIFFNLAFRNFIVSCLFVLPVKGFEVLCIIGYLV